jgi:hypothetical protein
MPKKSKATLRDEAIAAELEKFAFDTTKADYIRVKALGTLNAIRERQDRAKAEKQARAAARRAAEPVVYHNVLPNNFRGPPPGFVPVAVKPFVIPEGINRG